MSTFILGAAVAVLLWIVLTLLVEYVKMVEEFKSLERQNVVLRKRMKSLYEEIDQLEMEASRE